MKIKTENPPNYDLLKQAFKISDNILFCYGDTIYNPSNCYIDPLVIKHEAVHSKQQGDDPEKWWHRYLLDPSFRFCEELEAYQVQYRELKKVIKDRNQQNRYLNLLAKDLSSENYGNVCSMQEAIMSIRDNIKFHI